MLNGSPYHRSFLAERSLKLGSLTITESTIIIAFSKEISMIEPSGRMGIDVNERNVTWSDTSGNTKTHTELAKVAEIKEKYREIRAKTARKTQKDQRIQRRLPAKYGEREKNRTVQIINNASKEIVKHAKENRIGIVMEDLTLQRKDELMDAPRNAEASRLQGRMGRHSSHLYESERHIPKMPRLWLPRRAVAGEETLLRGVRRDMG